MGIASNVVVECANAIWESVARTWRKRSFSIGLPIENIPLKNALVGNRPDRNISIGPVICLFQCFDSCIVVGFMCNFGNKFFINDLTRFVENDNSAGKKSCKRAVNKFYAVIFTEFRRTESRYGNYIVDAFGRAKSGLVQKEGLSIRPVRLYCPFGRPVD